MVVSFDTGPTWANWKNMFKRFKKRYPEVEMAYNDIGSGATVVALDKARNRPRPTPPTTSAVRPSMPPTRGCWPGSSP